MNTALNRTTVVLLTNKSGGSVTYGAVVIIDTANAKAFTTTTSGAFANALIGVVLEPNGIANNAVGAVALGGWVPRINLNAAATIGQILKTHTVAGQATPHSAPFVAGDFGIALQASASPEAVLFNFVNQGGGGGSAAWSQVGSFTWSVNVTQVDFTGLGGYSEILVLIRQMTLSVSGLLCLRVSSDNGSTFLSASGDYVEMASNGSETNATMILTNETNATAARSSVTSIHGWNLTTPKIVQHHTRSQGGGYIPTTSTLNALRVLPLNGGNITGGTIAVYGR